MVVGRLLSFWVPVTFQGRTVSFGEGNGLLGVYTYDHEYHDLKVWVDDLKVWVDDLKVWVDDPKVWVDDLKVWVDASGLKAILTQ